MTFALIYSILWGRAVLFSRVCSVNLKLRRAMLLLINAARLISCVSRPYKYLFPFLIRLFP
jgi:hypothetical protein